MHTIEPFWKWRDKYTAETDENSPFFGSVYSEFEFSSVIYDHYIHPQWDFIESPTLYLKILFADYDEGFCIIEFIGEWNDVIHNDSMLLKREVIDFFLDKGINKYVLIGENILNFHAEDDCYYEEWFSELEIGGWIVPLNFREHVIDEMKRNYIMHYFEIDERFNNVYWRKFEPEKLVDLIEEILLLRLGA